ncbi:hypothetical protein ACS0TY_033485 [Phlomoides rotata]
MNLQQKNQIWPDDVLKRIVCNHELGMKHTVDLYNHSRQTANVTTRVQGTTSSRTFRWKLYGIPCSHALAVCRQYVVDPMGFVPKCYSTIEYALTYTLGFFAPLADVQEWGESNF